VEQELYQTKNQSNQDPLNFPIKLNNKLAALEGVVQASDAAPTSAVIDGLRRVGQQGKRPIGRSWIGC